MLRGPKTVNCPVKIIVTAQTLSALENARGKRQRSACLRSVVGKRVDPLQMRLGNVCLGHHSPNGAGNHHGLQVLSQHHG